MKRLCVRVCVGVVVGRQWRGKGVSSIFAMTCLLNHSEQTQKHCLSHIHLVLEQAARAHFAGVSKGNIKCSNPSQIMAGSCHLSQRGYPALALIKLLGPLTTK